MPRHDNSHQRTYKQLYRYICSGLLTTGCHVLIAALLIEQANTTQAFANGVAFLCAASLSYFLNALWSFSHHINQTSLGRFARVSLAGQSMAIGIGLLMDHLEVNYLGGIALIILTVTPVTFLLHKRWTFHE